MQYFVFHFFWMLYHYHHHSYLIFKSSGPFASKSIASLFSYTLFLTTTTFGFSLPLFSPPNKAATTTTTTTTKEKAKNKQWCPHFPRATCWPTFSVLFRVRFLLWDLFSLLTFCLFSFRQWPAELQLPGSLQDVAVSKWLSVWAPGQHDQQC